MVGARKLTECKPKPFCLRRGDERFERIGMRGQRGIDGRHSAGLVAVERHGVLAVAQHVRANVAGNPRDVCRELVAVGESPIRERDDGARKGLLNRFFRGVGIPERTERNDAEPASEELEIEGPGGGQRIGNRPARVKGGHGRRTKGTDNKGIRQRGASNLRAMGLMGKTATVKRNPSIVGYWPCIVVIFL